MAASESAQARVPTPEIRIESGALRGLIVGDKQDVCVYKGIPYADPPVGDLRWKPPRTVKPWRGVRDCFEFGAACPQTVPLLLAAIPEMSIGAPLSEDCLFLNVWAPAAAKSAKLPVLYWIHGGGFVMGAASQPLYDAEELARLGCIVVSVNYRIGLFGFLAHPALSSESPDHVSGNYGLLDQIEGLRWVRRNIAAFGGDPQRVTIFGESAGGISVLCLMVAPEARGLFNGAIAQSATALDLIPVGGQNPAKPDTAEQIGRRLIAACGLGDSTDPRQMRQLDARLLVKAAPVDGGPFRPGSPLRFKPPSVVVGPAVDGHLIPDRPTRLFAVGREHPVPLIIGNTRDEMALFLLTARMPADEAGYLKTLKEDFGEFAAPIAQAYPAGDASQIRSAAVQLATDLSFSVEARFIARSHAAAGNKVFRYQFSRGTRRGFLQFLGAHHGADVAFVFQRPLGRDEQELRISRTIGQYWTHFAATGDPNVQGVPPWPAYRADREAMLDFAGDVHLLSGHRNEQLDLIEIALRSKSAGRASD